MGRLHPAHDGHEIRCVTYDCTPGNHNDETHAVRCITCHTWADQEPRPRHTKPDPEPEATIPEPDQPALFEVGA